MAESHISPGELFKKHKLTDIENLVRKPNDKFYVFSASDYVKQTKAAIEKAPINKQYKKYLIALVEHVNNPRTVTENDIEVTYQTFKDRKSTRLNSSHT